MLIAVSALRIAAVVGEMRSDRVLDIYCTAGTDFNAEGGEALFHGVKGRVSWSMPAYSVAGALICHGKSPEEILALPAAAVFLCALLVFGIGALLSDVLGAAAGLAAYAFLAAGPDSFRERWLFTLGVALTAFLLVWRARSPSPAKTVLLAASIGLSMNILSPLFLLPPLLALWDGLITGARSPVRARLRESAILLFVPYLFLLPWISMNWRLGHGFVPFENGRADYNVITGALGFAKTLVCEPRQLAGISSDQSVLSWAIGEAARHPVRFLLAFFARLWYAFKLQPILLLACLPLWARAGTARRLLGLLIAYYLAVHCLMSAEARYFTPLWPVAAAGAGCLASWRSRPASIKLPWPRWVAGLSFIPMAGLTLFAMGLALAYPTRAADPGMIDRQIERYPQDSWLWSERGLQRLRDGKLDEAVGDLAKAQGLNPDSNERRLNLAVAKFIRGRSDANLIFSLPFPRNPMRLHLLRALCRLSLGRGAAALPELELAGQFKRSRSPVNEMERRAFIANYLIPEIRLWPAVQRAAIISALRELSKNGPFLDDDQIAGLYFDEALAAAEAGQTRQARLFLRIIQEAAETGKSEVHYVDTMRGLAGVALRIGDRDAALKAQRRLVRHRPKEAQALLDLAQLEIEAGHVVQARFFMARARQEGVESLSPRQAASVHRSLGEPGQAARLLESLVAADPQDGSLLMELAESCAQAGLIRQALEHMEGSLRLDGSTRNLSRAVHVLTGLREFDRALEIVGSLILREPGAAAHRNDRAVLLLLTGRKSEAEAELREAIFLGSDHADAYLSLGSLLASQGRKSEAVKLYDRALAQEEIRGDQAVLRLIRAGRAEASR